MRSVCVCVPLTAASSFPLSFHACHSIIAIPVALVAHPLQVLLLVSSPSVQQDQPFASREAGGESDRLNASHTKSSLLLPGEVKLKILSLPPKPFSFLSKDVGTHSARRGEEERITWMEKGFSERKRSQPGMKPSLTALTGTRP